MMLGRITTIARWTTVEMLRERVLYVAVLFAALLVVSSSILTPLAPGAQRKIVADFGLAAVDILGVLVILLTGSTLIHREMERRSLDILLSKPLTRLEYLFGKCLGVVLTLFALIVLMTVLFAITLEFAGFGWQANYLHAVLGSGMQMVVIASLAVLFSTFTSPTLAALFTLGLFLAGSLSESIVRLSGGAATATLLEKLSWIVPALGIFNFRGDVVHGVEISMQRIAVAAAYATLYAVTTLYVAAVIFRRRDFR